jgi:transcriptional regulator with XRE-family HTH domain
MTDKDTILKNFGSKLKEARLAKGLSQEALALELDFDRTYIGLLERGKRNPSLITIYKIVNRLEVDLGKGVASSRVTMLVVHR